MKTGAEENDLELCSRPSDFIESEHPEVVAFARRAVGSEASRREIAIRLYYAVRDGIRYDPYASGVSAEIFKASRTLARRRSFCVPKAILLAACARAFGIPSRLGFADVRNHLATKRLLELLRTDLFVFHGYTELYLDGRWVKATPAFNLSLCQKFGVKPLEFDGINDSILHSYDQAGNLHMEYVKDRGSYADLPLDEMVRAFRKHYPHLFREGKKTVDLVAGGGDFEAEALEESTSS